MCNLKVFEMSIKSKEVNNGSNDNFCPTDVSALIFSNISNITYELIEGYSPQLEIHTGCNEL